jgi:hypothetical protein
VAEGDVGVTRHWAAGPLLWACGPRCGCRWCPACSVC